MEEERKVRWVNMDPYLWKRYKEFYLKNKGVEADASSEEFRRDFMEAWYFIQPFFTDCIVTGRGPTVDHTREIEFQKIDILINMMKNGLKLELVE